MKPWIENIGLKEIRDGYHHDAGFNSMLIQIVDPATEFPTPKHAFRETHQYSFLDVDESDILNDIFDAAITDEDARNIAVNLLHAISSGMNVVVHCHMGVSRSGAVAEVGTILGFRDVGNWRAPNPLVKKKLLQHLKLENTPL